MKYMPTVTLGTKNDCASIEAKMQRDPNGQWVRVDLLEGLLEALEFYTDDEEWYRALEERGGGIAIPKRYEEDKGNVARQAVAWYKEMLQGDL